MSNVIACPLCSRRAGSAVDTIETRQLVDGYLRSNLKVDLASRFADHDQRIDLYQCAGCDLRWYAPAFAGDEEFYCALQRHDWYYEDEKSEYRFARDHVPQHARLLEVGCGRGAFRGLLPATVSYTGLEFNSEAIEKAVAEGLNVQKRSIEDEAREHPAQYDVVCHFQVLEHVANPRAFLQACADALKPGGSLIVAVPSEDSFVGLASSAWLNMPPHHLTRWSDHALATALTFVGLVPGQAWHEPVTEVHRGWQQMTAAVTGLRHLLRMRPRLHHGGLAGKLLHRIARSNALSAHLRRLALERYPQMAFGHTICMVGQKASDSTVV